MNDLVLNAGNEDDVLATCGVQFHHRTMNQVLKLVYLLNNSQYILLFLYDNYSYYDIICCTKQKKRHKPSVIICNDSNKRSK